MRCSAAVPACSADGRRRALVTGSFAAHRPDGVSPERAAVLPVAAGTAYDTLENLRLEPGSTLLVNGAGGGVGVALVQLARLRGLAVVGTASPAKHDLLTRLGATPVAYGDGVADRIRAAAADGIDGALDLVGGEALRVLGGLVPAGRLYSVADKPLVTQLGGAEVVRDRSTAVLRRARPAGRRRPARPARHRGPSAGRGGRGAGAGRGRARHREGRTDSLNPGTRRLSKDSRRLAADSNRRRKADGEIPSSAARVSPKRRGGVEARKHHQRSFPHCCSKASSAARCSPWSPSSSPASSGTSSAGSSSPSC